MSWVTPGQPAAATNSTTQYFSTPPSSTTQMATSAGPVGVGDVVAIQFDASSYMTSAGHPYRVVWRPSPSVPYMLIDSFTTEQLGQNEGLKRTFVFEYVFSAPGTYESEAMIKYDDPTTDSQESNKQNNTARMRIVVGDPGTPPATGNANLWIHTYSASAENTLNPPVKVGQPLEFEVSLYNKGDAPAENLVLLWRPHSGASFETISHISGLTESPPMTVPYVEYFTRTFNAPGTYETQVVVSYANTASTLSTQAQGPGNSKTLTVTVTP
jgi:hypothetical protein